MKTFNPAAQSHAYKEMSPKWEKIEAVLGGTEALREAGQTYLPPHPRESDANYKRRLSEATLFPAAEMTLEMWVGRPFSRNVQLTDASPAFMEFSENVDSCGNSISVFCRKWFKEGLAKGLAHIMVEFPKVDRTLPRTLADDAGLAPYWVFIEPEDVLYARAEYFNGKEVLTEVRIKEEILVPSEDGSEEEECRIRIYRPGMVTVYKEVAKDKWEIEEEVPYSLPFIPMVTFYADRDDFMTARPPLEGIVDLNLKHWRQQSDQDNILTVARFPMLAQSGGSPKVEGGGEVAIGPNKLLYTSDPSSKFYYVEHTGAAINVGMEALSVLKEEMAEWGAQFLKRNPSKISATAHVLDYNQSRSALQDAVNRFQDAVNQALYFTSVWMKTDTYPTASIYNDDAAVDANSAEIQTLAQERENHVISRDAYIFELKRRNVLDDTYDPEGDLEKIEKDIENESKQFAYGANAGAGAGAAFGNGPKPPGAAANAGRPGQPDSPSDSRPTS